MKYNKIKKGIFLSRPNRFIANVLINGKQEVCHVKNTGRCRELLVEGAEVVLEDCKHNPNRKTRYDLIAVYKGERLVNMDSQAPNKVVQEHLPKLFKDLVVIRPERKYKNSRFDFYVETKKDKIFIEVKGVTLEQNEVVRFPDAPTTRGTKHIKELIECVNDGYKACIIFVIQMKGVKYFSPNWETDPKFTCELRQAQKRGVEIICLDCLVQPDSLSINGLVDYRLD